MLLLSFKRLHRRAVICVRPVVFLPLERALLRRFSSLWMHRRTMKNNWTRRAKAKFKIVSLKVKGGLEYVPELFDEQKDHVAVEQILRVVFLDAERPSPAMEKLKHRLAEAEAALQVRKKPQPDTGPRVVGEGLVIDEWKERREKYLARQQDEAAVQ
ncbi:hypothetical protein OIU78_017755 [Salix suchowensis]|nr:hypothetical protein OIU78_017755 [Salix suchowensis]